MWTGQLGSAQHSMISCERNKVPRSVRCMLAYRIQRHGCVFVVLIGQGTLGKMTDAQHVYCVISYVPSSINARPKGCQRRINCSR